MSVPALPPLYLIRAFHAVGEAGSIRKGADALGLSHTVVSRHVRNLEAYLGARLFERTPSGVTLTPEGNQLFETADAALRQLAGAIETLMPAEPGGRLRIWAMPGLAGRWLGPRLAEIEALLPRVEISIRATETAPDFATSEADLFIGYAPFGAEPEGAHRLMTPRMFPVASPEWIANNGIPPTLAALARQPLIHENDHRQWRRWLNALGLDDAVPLSGPRLWNASLSLDAAAAHQGIALATQLSAAREITQGRLVELMDTDVAIGAYYLLVAPEKRNKPATLTFVGWLEEALKRGKEA